MSELERKSYMLDFDSVTNGGNPFNAVVTEPQEPQEPQDPEVDPQPSEPKDPQNPQDLDDDFVDQQIDPQGVDDDDSDFDDDTDTVDPDPDDDPLGGEGEPDEESLYYYIGEELKQDGFLPEDFELSKSVDGMSVYEAYKQKLRNDIEPIVKNEATQKLYEQGYDDNDLLMARAIRQGVDPRMLHTASMYEMLASTPEDSPQDNKLEVISNMYRTRGFNEDEIKNQVQIAIDNENVDQVFGRAREYFSGKYQEFVNQENERAKELQALQEQQARKADELLSNVITSKEVLGEKLSDAEAKAFEDAVRKENQVIEFNGQKFMATELTKFLFDFQMNDEIKLLAFKLIKFREQERERIRKEAKQDVEREFLKGYKKKVLKSKRASKSSSAASQLKDNKKTSNSYFIDFSNQQ